MGYTEERYEKEYSQENILDNIYSLINPVGGYDYYATSRILAWYVRMIIKNKGNKRLQDIRILDAGCGDGRKTRIVAELLGNSECVKSFDLVEEGVDYSRRVNSSIDCKVGNIITDFPKYDIFFDGIMACTVFMFIKSRDEIIKALSNIYDNLDDDGLFLWLESNANSHFEEGITDTVIGFNENEMDALAEETGFIKFDSQGLFKNISCNGNEVSTYYLVENLGIAKAELLNEISLLRNTMNARVYSKKPGDNK